MRVTLLYFFTVPCLASTDGLFHARQGRYLMNNTIEEEIIAAEAEEQELYGTYKRAKEALEPLCDAWSDACQRLTKLRAKAEVLAEMKGEK